MINRSRRIRWQICFVVGLAVVVGASQAQARTESLAWTYLEPELINGFEVLWGTSPGSYSNRIDVKMASQSGSEYVYNLTVPDSATVYIAVRAYDSSGERSATSNERVRAPAGTGEPASSGSDTGSLPPPPTTLPGSGTVLDFTGSSTGNAVDGWVDTISGNRMATDDRLFATTMLDGQRVMTTSSSDTNIHSHYVLDDSDGWSGYEVRGAMLLTDANGGIGVTAHSQYPSRDAYYRLRSYEGRSFHLAPHGTTHTCSRTETGVAPQAGAWYRFALRVDPGSSSTRVRAKVWRDGSSEPGSWQADCTDSSSSRLNAGTVGIWSMTNGTKYWTALEVSVDDGVPSGGSTSEPLQPPTLIEVQPVSP
jgi:hypothetical protein